MVDILSIGVNTKALEMYEKALPIFEESGDIESVSIDLHRKAKVLAEMGKRDEPLALFEKGIANLEKIREQAGFSEMKKSFFEKVYNQYQYVALFMLENGTIKKASSIRNR